MFSNKKHLKNIHSIYTILTAFSIMLKKKKVCELLCHQINNSCFKLEYLADCSDSSINVN